MNHLIIIIDNIVKVNSFSSNYSVLKTNHIHTEMVKHFFMPPTFNGNNLFSSLPCLQQI